ncbi:NAD(P)-binding domain-containing protein [Fulvivirga sp.]|uniref:NADPH-dependent F420 reductase n=1 Tax=Fulvivirga sp. TaxID=1931237 RepID=UPI0032EAFB53
MKIAIIGTGNVGGSLATKWANAGHKIVLGVRDINNFKGQELLKNPNTEAMSVPEAAKASEVILIATPAPMAIEVAKSLGDTAGKIIVDTMNVVMGRGPEGFANTSDAILACTNTKDVVKSFNTTGFNNIENTIYGDQRIDMFMCGDSSNGKRVVVQLAKDAGFQECHDIGGNDKFQLMEQFAWFWINLAMKNKNRDFAFKILKR